MRHPRHAHEEVEGAVPVTVHAAFRARAWLAAAVGRRGAARAAAVRGDCTKPHHRVISFHKTTGGGLATSGRP